MKKSTKNAITILSALAVMGAIAQTATVTWGGGGWDGLWITPTNWDTNVVPAAGNTIVINTAVTVNSLGLPAFGNLPLGATVNLTGGATLVDFTNDAASMNNPLFQTAGGLNVLNAGASTANLQWNDTTEAIELNVTAVPEPTSFVLLGIGTLAIFFRRNRL